MPSSWDLPDPGITPISLASPALAGRFFTTSATWEACGHYRFMIYYNITDEKRIEFSFGVGTAYCPVRWLGTPQWAVTPSKNVPAQLPICS